MKGKTCLNYRGPCHTGSLLKLIWKMIAEREENEGGSKDG